MTVDERGWGRGLLANRLTLPEEDPLIFTPDLVDEIQAPPEVWQSLAFNWSYVRTHHRETHRQQSTYCFRLPHLTSELEVANNTIIALTRQSLMCRWNVSFCLILERMYSEPREMTVFYASRNSALFDRMQMAASTDDFSFARDEILKHDIWETVSKRLPNTKWKVHSIFGMTVYVIRLLDHPLV